jgi:hypothetical protein
VPAALALLAGDVDGQSVVAALPWLGGGLGLRFWAFIWLGGAGRTRSLEPPASRVIGGPFRLLAHPVYLANLAVAAGLLIACAPPGWLTALLLASVAAFYGALAEREGGQLRGLPARSAALVSVRQVARSERSTWLVVALFLILACC